MATTVDLMDPLALFTQGEFRCFESDDPELLLYTQGEFPRVAQRRGITTSDPGGQGAATGRWRREQERWEKIREQERCERLRRETEDAIVISLLMSTLEDDLDEWF